MTKSMAAEWAAPGVRVKAIDGNNLTGMEQSARRHLLEDLLEDEVGVIRLSEQVEADGDVSFASACEHGLEGIVAKHRDRQNPELSRVARYSHTISRLCRDARCSFRLRGNASLTLHHATTMSVCPKSLPLNSSGMRWACAQA
jgi:hypothetical protein